MGHGANPRTEIDAIVRELLIRLDDKGILSVPILLSSHPATPANLRGLAQPPNDLIHRLRRRARSSHSSAGTPSFPAELGEPPSAIGIWRTRVELIVKAEGACRELVRV
jgi:hypothetical protein